MNVFILLNKVQILKAESFILGLPPHRPTVTTTYNINQIKQNMNRKEGQRVERGHANKTISYETIITYDSTKQNNVVKYLYLTTKCGKKVY